MDRKKELLRFASKDALGIEIAPYFNPLTPKSDGYNCRIVDVFDQDDLRATAKNDASIAQESLTKIEPVDFVGDASHLDELLHGRAEFGTCAYIVSSHNFEHLPNPIRFLRGCESVLRPGGMLSMAIPDYRACFDYFRFPTRLADWIDAYHEDREKPSPASILDAQLGTATYRGKDGRTRPAFRLGTAKFERFTFENDVSGAYSAYLEPAQTYTDTHCSLTCPEIFHLLISDLIHMGLVGLEVASISKTRRYEYFVHLRKPQERPSVYQDGYSAHRPHLLNAARRAIGYPDRRSPFARLRTSISESSALGRLTGRRVSARYVVDQT